MATLAGYTLGAPIGRGTMGEVWRATAPDGTRVALKVAQPSVVRDPRVMRLVDGEVRAMARLDHPAIVWVYDHGRVPDGAEAPFAPGAPYIVLEHCGGGTLEQQRIEDWSAVRDVAVRLLDALAHTHAHGIVHRDLKPANVLWPAATDVRPGAKLGDFGVAHAIGLASRSKAGTPLYMAPEQAAGGALGPWTDLYSLGAVLWELVTGAAPYGGASVSEILAASRLGPLPAFSPRFAVPDGLDRWLVRLLASAPEGRFRWAAHALRALAAFDPAVRPDPRELPRRRLRLQGAGLALLPIRHVELVGRGAERAVLWGAAERAVGGAVTCVVLRGATGIGKSRLAAWLAERVAEEGLAEAVTVDAAAGDPLGPLLAGLLGIRGGPAEITAALAARGVAPAAAEQVAEPLERADGSWGPAPAVRAAVRALVGDRPRVLVIDEAHTCEAAIQLAHALLAEREAHPVPLLLVLAADAAAVAERPAALSLLEALEGVDGAATLHLGPMPLPDQEALLEALVGLDPEAHARLLAAADGHPGYLVAQVEAWSRDGLLIPTARGFRLRRTPAAATGPASLAALWEGRLDRLAATLDPLSERLLEAAAAAGRVVDEALWEDATADAGAGADGRGIHDPVRARARVALVDRLVASGLATETEHGFAFAHPALVDALHRRARAAGRYEAHHRALAACLAQRPHPSVALRLGTHLAEGGDDAAAIGPLCDGIRHGLHHGDRRLLMAEVARAERCADRAGVGGDDPRRATILLLRGFLSIGLGQVDDARSASEAAWRIARSRGDRRLTAEAAMRMIDVHAIAGDWDGAAPWIHRFLAVEDAAPRPQWGGIVRGRLGYHLRHTDPDAAARWFAEGEATLRRALDGADLQITADLLGALVEVLSLADDAERTLETARRAEAAAASLGRTTDQLFAASKQLEAAVTCGRWEDGRVAGRRGIALAEAMGDLRSSVFLRLQLANLEIRARAFGAAHGWALDAARLTDRLRSPWQSALVWMLLGDCQLELGDGDGFDRSVARLADLVPAVPPSEVQLVEGLARWLTRVDDARRGRIEALIARAHGAHR